MTFQGKINIYICDESNHQTVTIDADEGTTPFMTMCQYPGCSSIAKSCFYKVDQDLTPTHEWYAPEAKQMRRLERKYPGTKYHVSKGGLLLRKIKRARG